MKENPGIGEQKGKFRPLRSDPFVLFSSVGALNNIKITTSDACVNSRWPYAFLNWALFIIIIKAVVFYFCFPFSSVCLGVELWGILYVLSIFVFFISCFLYFLYFKYFLVFIFYFVFSFYYILLFFNLFVRMEYYLSRSPH